MDRTVGIGLGTSILVGIQNISIIANLTSVGVVSIAFTIGKFVFSSLNTRLSSTQIEKIIGARKTLNWIGRRIKLSTTRNILDINGATFIRTLEIIIGLTLNTSSKTRINFTEIDHLIRIFLTSFIIPQKVSSLTLFTFGSIFSDKTIFDFNFFTNLFIGNVFDSLLLNQLITDNVINW